MLTFSWAAVLDTIYWKEFTTLNSKTHYLISGEYFVLGQLIIFVNDHDQQENKADSPRYCYLHCFMLYNICLFMVLFNKWIIHEINNIKFLKIMYIYVVNIVLFDNKSITTDELYCLYWWNVLKLLLTLSRDSNTIRNKIKYRKEHLSSNSTNTTQISNIASI